MILKQKREGGNGEIPKQVRDDIFSIYVEELALGYMGEERKGPGAA
jgi:hypothetical protein